MPISKFFVRIIIGISVFVSLIVAVKSMPAYRVYWLRTGNLLSQVNLLHILSLVFFGAILIFLIKFQDKFANWMLLSGIGIIVVVLNLSAYRPFHDAWNFRIATSTHLNPFFSKSRTIQNPILYPAEHLQSSQKGYRSRLDTYPPGLPIYYYYVTTIVRYLPVDYFPSGNEDALMNLLNREEMPTCDLTPEVIDSAKLLAVLGLLYLLSIPLLVYFIIALIDSRENGLYGAVVCAMVPSFHLFCDMPNISFAAFSLLIAYLAVAGIKKENLILIFLSGLLFSFALFFSMSFAVIGFFIFLFGFLELYHKSRQLKIRIAGVFACAVLIPIIALFCLGYNTLEMLYRINLNNQEFYLLSSRERFSAFGINLFELFLFTGGIWPILFFRAVPIFIPEFISTLCKKKPLSLSQNFTFSSMVTIIILLVSGGVRGEIARNGILIMPLIIIPLILHYRFNRKEFCILATLGLVFFVLVCSLMEVSFSFLVF